MGGTGANHVMLGTGDAIWFSDGNGNPAVPPHNQVVRSGTELPGTVDEIENPNAAPGTNNWYTEDGYGGGGLRRLERREAVSAAEPTATVPIPTRRVFLRF